MIDVNKKVEDWLREEYHMVNYKVVQAAKPAVYRDMVEGMKEVARSLIHGVNESPEGYQILCFIPGGGYYDGLGFEVIYAGEDWESYFKTKNVKAWIKLVDLKDLLKLLSLPKELNDGENKDNNDREWVFR